MATPPLRFLAVLAAAVGRAGGSVLEPRAAGLESRRAELLQELLRIETRLGSAAAATGGCQDSNSYCSQWAHGGECSSNAAWMTSNCAKSCGACSETPAAPACGGTDANANCAAWAKRGECEKNSAWMSVHCKASCFPCEDHGSDDVPPVTPGDCDTVQSCGDGEKCSDARSECFKTVDWAMTDGVAAHPEWYPGLSADSSFEDFQEFMHTSGQGGCPKPCPHTTTTTTTTTTTPPPGTPACPKRRALPEPPRSSPTQYNGISWPELCYVGWEEEHVFIIGDWGGISYGREPQPAPNTGKKRAVVPGIDDKAQVLVAQAFNKRAARSKPRYVLNGGDNFYWAGIAEDCGKSCDQSLEDFRNTRKHNTKQVKNVFEDLYKGPGVDGIPWFFCLGNHDYGGFKFNRAWDQQIYYTWAPSGRWILPGQYWHQHVDYLTQNFSVDYYMIDTNNLDVEDPSVDPGHNICSMENNKGSTCKPFGPGDPHECQRWFTKLWNDQMAWFEEKLKASTADWQIVNTHFPPEPWWRSGAIPSSQEVVKQWKRLGDTYGIDFMVSSHRHRQEMHPDGTSAARYSGIPYVVVGGGGGVTSENTPGPSKESVASWRVSNPDPPGSKPSYPPGYQYGFMDMTITKEKLHIDSLSYDGGFLESMEVLPRGKMRTVLCADVGCDEYNKQYLCQCTKRCKDYGNCCADYAEACAPTCAKVGCGRYIPGNSCQCNDQCQDYRSCCSDYSSVCEFPSTV